MASDYVDRYARGRSVCHRLPPLFRVGATLAVILAALLTPPEMWPLHGVLLASIFAAQSLAGIALSYLAKRLAVFLPFLGLVALSLPLSQGFTSGWDVAAAVMFRGTVSFMAVLWLVNVMPFDLLLVTLRRLWVPELLLSLLAFAYRYVFVLWDELDRMQTARRSRSFGETGLQWRTSVQLVGMLLVRALTRAERVHGAMCARGWDGRVRRLEEGQMAEDQ